MKTEIQAKLLSIIQTCVPYDACSKDGYLEMRYRLGAHDLSLQANATGGYSIFAKLTKDAYGLPKEFTHSVVVNSIYLVHAFEDRFEKELKKRQEETRIAAEAHKAKMEAEFLAALGE